MIEPTPAEQAEKIRAELTQNLKDLASARYRLAELSALKSAAYDKFNADNATLLKDHEATKSKVGIIETDIKAQALALFGITENKKPEPHIGIRESTKYEYDAAQALAWATEHRLALTLDVKAFEGIAEASPATVPFVKAQKIASATIATKLDDLLPEQTALLDVEATGGANMGHGDS